MTEFVSVIAVDRLSAKYYYDVRNKRDLILLIDMCFTLVFSCALYIMQGLMQYGLCVVVLFTLSSECRCFKLLHKTGRSR